MTNKPQELSDDALDLVTGGAGKFGISSIQDDHTVTPMMTEGPQRIDSNQIKPIDITQSIGQTPFVPNTPADRLNSVLNSVQNAMRDADTLVKTKFGV